MTNQVTQPFTHGQGEYILVESSRSEYVGRGRDGDTYLNYITLSDAEFLRAITYEVSRTYNSIDPIHDAQDNSHIQRIAELFEDHAAGRLYTNSFWYIDSGRFVEEHWGI